LFTVASDVHPAFNLSAYHVRERAIELSREFGWIDVLAMISADKKSIEPLSPRQAANVRRYYVIVTEAHVLIRSEFRSKLQSCCHGGRFDTIHWF
jgi:hypothetical protein